MTTYQLLSFSVLVHIIFLFSVFDIYFKSTVIVGVSPVNNSVRPSGKRVVVISADGLRFDSLFNKDSNSIEDVMPYIKSIIQERGSWGLSESHIPTESRPGHVSMLAGFYEDPSAVTKGWKENPVTFDSVFNQSFCSFAWGSPDILGIFFKGLDRDCAFSHTYENEQNFAGNTMEYDNWVLREFKAFLNNSGSKSILFEDGVFFFLHLLGQDTSGHTHKPHTEKYIQNLKNVDRIVQEVEILINEFYRDNLTSFVFTSDHGMTDWGSHGSGHPNETNTPIVAWGAGINKPLANHQMINISQADITPLLSILLGCSIPVNSVGTIPLEYLDMKDNYKARAMLLNAEQISAQFQTNLQKIKTQTISFFHTPFEKLTNEDLELMLASILEQITNEQYSDAIQKSKFLIDLGLEGLEYYQNYYQRLLIISISSSYILWIVYLTLILYDKGRPVYNESSRILDTLLFISTVVTLVLTVIQRLPFSYSFYFLLPQLLLYFCMMKVKQYHYNLLKKNLMTVFSSVLLIVAGVEVIVASFFHRYFLCASLIFALLGSLLSFDLKKSEKTILWLWFLSGVILSAFCILPIVGGQPNVVLIVTSGFALFVFLLLMLLFNVHRENIVLYSVRCLTVAAAAWNNAVVHTNFMDDNELTEFNQFLSWGLCAFALFLLVISKTHILDRFDQVFISFLVPFLLLSICHEGLFVLFLFIHLRCWIFVEYEYFGKNRLENDKVKGYLLFSDFRRSYFFLLYIWVGFFGLGNIASLNSFDPAWVRCFITVFSPFLMSSLILFKTVIPFLIVTCSMRALTVILKLRQDQLFIIVLIYCNIMGLNFLYLIRNRGSWLDIGSSISHYVIQQLTIVFLLLLYGVAKFLLSFSLPNLPFFRQGSKPEIDTFHSEESLFSLPRYHSSHKLHRS